MIRAARFTDIPAIIDLGKEAHAESRLAGICQVDEAKAKSVLYALISGAGKPADGATCPLVAERDGAVVGIIIGIIRRSYEVLNQHVCTDLIWYASPRATPRTALRLLDGLHTWADSFQYPVRKQHLVHDIIVDPVRSGKILQRKGMRCIGFLYEKE